ncbi:DUF3971 domain-containing protein [Bosea sp. 117]|uniref:YhdP family protein n=1 Tax=Bosea sp. 117 TaxID=1125973 RepID=UPI0004945F44|nr:DUF3971 domain-containing protein [Bosea sp. 117]
MKAAPTRKDANAPARPVRRTRLRRVARPCAPSPRSPRWLRMCGWSALGFAILLLAAGGGLYTLFTTGMLTVDMARPYVVQALEERIGGGKTVEIGAITNAGDNDSGETVLRVSDIVVRDPDGEVIASAPQAEVALQSGAMPWSISPRRIELVGAELTVRINAQGELTIATGHGAKPLHATAPVPPSAHRPQGAGQGATASAPPAGAPDGAPAPAKAPALPFDPTQLQRLAAFADTIDRSGLDGASLSGIGLKDGTLRVQSDISGRSWTFDHIGLDVTRPPEGGVALNLTSGGTDGPWSARAVIGSRGDGERPITIEVRDLAPRDLMVAAGKGDEPLIATSPLSFDLKSRMDADGTVLAAEGALVAGAGKLQIGDDAAGLMVIDEASLRFRFDPDRRVLMLEPLAIQAGPLDLQMTAEVTAPDDTGQPWRLHTTAARASLGGGGPDGEKEPPLVFDRMAFDLRYEPGAHRFVIDRADLKAGTVGVTLAGNLDLGAADPALSLSVAGTPMSATALKRLWPIVAAPDVRRWVLDHVVGGDVSRANISFTAPLNSIGNKARPLPAEGLSIDIAGAKGMLRPVPGLPAMRDATVTVQATGRSAHVVATNAVMETQDGRKLSLPESVLDVPDTAPVNPEAKISVKVEGSAAAAVELMSSPALRGSSGQQFDPATVKGNINGLAQVNVRLKQDMSEKDVDYAFEADLTDFSADKIFQGQKLENATVKVFATPAAMVFRGEGKLAGAPASFEMKKPRDGGDTEFRVAANIDDAARNRMNLDLAGLSGTVAIKVNGVINARGKTADVEIDLGAARLAELVPGWSKPAGKPAKLTAKAVISNDDIRLNDLVVAGSGVNIRGSVDLDGKGGLQAANLPTFQLSDGDKANVKVESADGALKITVRGEVIEARAFLKNLLDAPIAGNKEQKPADIDLDVNLGVVTGNNGEAMRQAVLRMSRRNGDLRAFSLGALVGRNGGVRGELKARDNGRPMLQIATTDAGALLRFVDFYARIYGGDLWINIDAPRGDGAPQDGTINMRDFVVRGEPGLDRLIAAAPAGDRGRDGRAQPGAAVVFNKLQVDFQRAAGRLVLRESAIWGPTIGSTFDGQIDFANDRIGVRGTYVPAYGLNNLFSKLPVLGFFLGGGPNEGLVGVTYEIVGPLSGPTLRINPISAVAPGFLRKIFEFRQAPDPTPPAVVPTR